MGLFTIFCTYSSHADYFFFCWSINLKMISTLECLLQTQIHVKNTHAEAKNRLENTKLRGQNHWEISAELMDHGWGSNHSGRFVL